MPAENLPDETGSPYSSNQPAAKPGDQAFQIALQQLGKPYVYGATGPDSFDCSGLMYYSYYTAPGSPNLKIGRDTTSQWNNLTVLTTVYDAVAAQAQALQPIGVDQLEVGDLLLYFQPGNSGENAHVKMYAGGGITIEAPHTGDVVKKNPVDLVGDTSEPFRGVKRPIGGGSSGAAGAAESTEGNADTSGQGAGQQTPTASGWDTQVTNLQPVLQNLKDPTSNLPFSAFFQGQKVPGAAVAGVGGRSGSLALPIASGQNGFMPNTQLVRGGMVELIAKKFKCYFMMNPQTIAADCGINTDQTSPLEMDPTQAQQGGYWVTNETVSFTLYFNRMYEVWHGGVPGPSDIGCRWDIRALERLMGIFDAIAGTNSSTGEGKFGAGNGGARTMLLQVAFGGPNSLQFQGVVASFDYTYTLFDANMIPIEAYADVSVMRIYQPSMSSAPLTSSLITQTGQVGAQAMPLPKGASRPMQTFTANR